LNCVYFVPSRPRRRGSQSQHQDPKSPHLNSVARNRSTTNDTGFENPPPSDQASERFPFLGTVGQHISPMPPSSEGSFMFDKDAQACQAPPINSPPTSMGFSFLDDPIMSPTTNLPPYTPTDEDFHFVGQERLHAEPLKIDGRSRDESLDCKCGSCGLAWLSC